MQDTYNILSAPCVPAAALAAAVGPDFGKDLKNVRHNLGSIRLAMTRG